MNNKAVALMIYGDSNSSRDALTEDKYKLLARSLLEAGFAVESVLYHDAKADALEGELLRFAAVLVWVNPIEPGFTRKRLDVLLQKLSSSGVFVSAHPEIILKIGTKKVLYTTRQMDWGGDIEMYSDFEDFAGRFFDSLGSSGTRVLKQYRGNGGQGVFKVRLYDTKFKTVCVIHAQVPDEERILSTEDFISEFKKYFNNGGVLLNQPWADGLDNGIVRCYMSGSSVAGFGYQESNALCPLTNDPESKVRPLSKRYYFSEYCGLFQDLRAIMESKWITELKKIHSIAEDLMPLLWDADFFINDVNSMHTEAKYTLCEINVSSVSPFPESCVNQIVRNLSRRLNK